jgi:hypothetical protein
VQEYKWEQRVKGIPNGVDCFTGEIYEVGDELCRYIEVGSVSTVNNVSLFHQESGTALAGIAQSW